MITLEAAQVWGGLAVTLILGILGNGLLQTVLQRKWQKEDKKNEKAEKKEAWQTALEERMDAVQSVCDIMLYHTLADKLEYYRVRGWADDTDRREIVKLHQIYEDRGFNGDMDSRMKTFFELPMEEKEVETDFFDK